MEYQTFSNDPADPSGGKWRKRIRSLLPLIILTAIILLLAVVLAMKSKKLDAEKKAAFSKTEEGINVVTLELIPRPIQDRINLPGIIDPWVKLVVKSEVNARVIKKAAKEGDLVKKGDIIAVLDARKYENDFKSAKADYDKALTNFNRIESLHKEELATTAQMDNASAQIENFKADMGNTAHDLENCTIRAAIPGVVNRLFIEEGQYVNVSTDIAEILQMDRLKVNVGIPESDVNDVRKLETFDVKIDALDGKVFPGKKNFLSRSADTGARLYNLEIMIENSSGEILPDMFARVEIIKRVVSDSVAVPLYSLIPYKGGHIVYIEKDGRAHLKEVKTGIQDGDFIQVTEGLNPGDRVIVTGHRSVSDGQKVTVVSTRKPEDIAE